jgi:hypothetical protein
MCAIAPGLLIKMGASLISSSEVAEIMGMSPILYDLLGNNISFFVGSTEA